jgi:hypothetical protein
MVYRIGVGLKAELVVLTHSRRNKLESLPLQRTFHLLVLGLILSLLGAAPSWAGGGQHYPNGAEDFVVGALPPPGVYLVNYLLLATKNRLVDNSGHSIGEFKADVEAEVARFIYVSPHKLLGANWGAHLFLPYYAANVQLGTSPGDPKSMIDSDVAGIGDIIFSPLILGWHFGPNFHLVAALDIFAPTGNYDKYRPATQILSRNDWTVEPVLAATYLWRGFDVDAKLMYDFSTKNDAYIGPASGGVQADLTPGQEFHVDWAVGYAPQNGLRFGVVGYNYWQITNDQINDRDVRDQKSRVGGIGAGVKYWPDRGRFSMTLKQYWEYGARNMATGPSTWLKVGFKF